MWGMETLKKLKQKAGSRETEPSAGAAPEQGAASSTAPDASPVSARQVLAKFASYYRPYTFLFVFDLVCATVLACVDLAFPQFLSFFTKDFFQSSPEAIIGSLWWIALLFVVLYGVRTACQYFITSWGHIMGARMEADMHMDLFKQYQRLSFSYYNRNNTGEMMSKLVTDLFDISELAHHGPENLFICILKIVGSFALLFLINVPLTAIMLVATLLAGRVLVLAQLPEARHLRREPQEDGRHQRAPAGLARRHPRGEVVRQRAGGDQEVRPHERPLRGHERELVQVHGVVSCGELAVHRRAVHGYHRGRRLLRGHGRPCGADLAIYALYIGIFISPIEQLINFVETFQKGYAGFRRFMEVLAVRPDIADAPDAVDLGAAERARCGGPDGHVAGEVRYRDVHFSYDGVQVLRGLDLAIPAGATVALVGPSGGGKTTTCSLLPRFYDPERGSVEIDGIDIRAVTVESLRDAIGIVQQDVYLFGGTIRDNIAYGRPDATTAEIVEAAKRANIDAFVRGLPDGYDTYVGERGARLSGGQKQRIAIARRVFLKDPRILILDEATSALDNESERAIQKSLEELSAGRTTLVIAHRLSTIRGADLIAVVEDGRVAERGTHEQLLALGGTYAHYYEMQFGPVEQGAVL